MKTIILFFSLLVAFPSIAQQQVLVLTKTKTGKTKVYQVNSRIKVKAFDKEKFTGRFQIVDEKTIMIDKRTIPLDSINNIQSKPIGGDIVATFFLVSGGTTSLIALVNGCIVCGYILIAGVVVMSPAILYNAFIGNHYSKRWNYDIVEYGKVIDMEIGPNRKIEQKE